VDYINPEFSFLLIERLKINLSDCVLNKAVYENLAFVLHCMRKVKELGLLFCSTKSMHKGFEQIICSLPNFPKLMKLKLDLKKSEFGLEILEVLIISLQHLKFLRSLKLNLYQIPSLRLKEVKEFCKVIAKMDILQKIRFNVKEKGKKKCVEALNQFVNFRQALLYFSLKYKLLNKETRGKLLVNYINKIFLNKK